jgi:Icc protein
MCHARRMGRFAFVQLSDVHLCADPAAQVHGVAPYARLERAIAHVRSLAPAPAFALLTGDLIHDDDERSYAHVRALCERLEIPVHYVMGNHDLRGAFRRTLRGDADDVDAPVRYSFGHAGWRFVILDSSVPGEVEGRVGEEQLDWLRGELASGEPTFVVLHHAPVPFGVEWLDDHRVQDGERLMEVLAAAGNVRQVLFGHVHMDLSVSRGALHLRGAPSTVWRFGDGDAQPQIAPAEGGYRWVEVDGETISSRSLWF